MNNPNVSTHSDSVNDTEGIPAMPECNFEHAAVKVLKQPGGVRLATLGGYRESIQHVALHVAGEFFKIPPCRLDP